LHLFPAREDGWFPPVLTTSALEQKGIDEVVQLLSHYTTWMQERSLFNERRKKQNLSWLHEELRARIVERFYENSDVKSRLEAMERIVSDGSISPFQAASDLLKGIK
jgi:LAO/AO transport system kinase